MLPTRRTTDPRTATADRLIRSAAILAAAGVLAACGGSSGSNESTPSGGSSTVVGAAPGPITVTSMAFTDGSPIPAQYTCAGGGKAPALAWSGNVGSAAALAVVVDDLDAPGGSFLHWVVFDLPPTTTQLQADAVPKAARQARNSAFSAGWLAPCPRSGTHRYRFTVHALKATIGMPDEAIATDAQRAIDAATLAKGQLIGTVAS